jgi:hypothetical protein
VTAQLLSAPRPRGVLETVRALGNVQMDPTSVVARTEHLVLFSRLGRRYRPEELERLLWTERSLFEYRAFIFPTSDFEVHRETMRRFPSTDNSRHAYVRTFLADNAGFRRYVMRRLRREGPLRTRDLEDRSAVGWRTGGWNDDGRNVGMMLEVLWARGEVMIVGRDGQQRLWDLGERRLPFDEPRLPAGEEARRLIEGQLRAAGVARPSMVGRTFEGIRPPRWEPTVRALMREGLVVPVEVEGLRGERLAHTEVLDRPFRPRTVLLSPFDRLIHDRQRTEELFGFRYRLEIYVPPAKREFGYFVLPILDGDRLIGRINPTFDRQRRVLLVDGLWAEADVPESAGDRVAAAISELAAWLGARDVELKGPQPPAWASALRSHLMSSAPPRRKASPARPRRRRS